MVLWFVTNHVSTCFGGITHLDAPKAGVHCESCVILDGVMASISGWQKDCIALVILVQITTNLF